jgi:hypothetical protein
MKASALMCHAKRFEETDKSESVPKQAQLTYLPNRRCGTPERVFNAGERKSGLDLLT